MGTLSRQALLDSFKADNELQKATVTIGGEELDVYFRPKVTLAERDAVTSCSTVDPITKQISMSERGTVRTIIARARDEDGKPLFFSTDEKRLLERCSADEITAIFNAIGGAGFGTLIALDDEKPAEVVSLVEAAGKN